MMKNMLILTSLQLVLWFNFISDARCDIYFCPFDIIVDDWYIGLLHDEELYCTDGEIVFYQSNAIDNAALPVYCNSTPIVCELCTKSLTSINNNSEAKKETDPNKNIPEGVPQEPKAQKYNSKSNHRNYEIIESTRKFWRLRDTDIYFETFRVKGTTYNSGTMEPNPKKVNAMNYGNRLTHSPDIGTPITVLDPSQIQDASIAYKDSNGIWNTRTTSNVKVITFKDANGLTHKFYVR